jgi:hypothetical protein
MLKWAGIGRHFSILTSYNCKYWLNKLKYSWLCSPFVIEGAPANAFPCSSKYFRNISTFVTQIDTYEVCYQYSYMWGELSIQTHVKRAIDADAECFHCLQTYRFCWRVCRWESVADVVYTDPPTRWKVWFMDILSHQPIWSITKS